jgi:hypothetical protein
MHAVMKIAHQNPLLSVAQKAHTMPTTQTILSTRETTSFGGVYVSRLSEGRRARRRHHRVPSSLP